MVLESSHIFTSQSYQPLFHLLLQLPPSHRRTLHPCPGATCKSPSIGQCLLHPRCAGNCRWSIASLFLYGDGLSPLSHCKEACVPVICRGWIRTGLAMLTQCSSFPTSPRHESTMDLHQEKSPQILFPADDSRLIACLSMSARLSTAGRFLEALSSVP